METTMFFPLLLLMCSTSTAQLQTEADNQSLPHGEQTEARRTNDPDPQHTYHIHAVLREMSASLAEQRVEMRHLQRENEAQAAKLIELESQNAEINKLLKVKQVAFSASLLASGSGNVGPFSTHTPLVFRHVVTNIGGAYNSNSGSFIAPVRGAYHFEFYIGAIADSSRSSSVHLMKNTELIFTAYEQQTSGFGTAANGVTLLLEIGDVVFLRQWAGTWSHDSENHHTTFSGHLLFTM